MITTVFTEQLQNCKNSERISLMDIKNFLIQNPNQDEKSFGKFVRQRREELGYTLRSFAKEIDMMPSYLSDVEKGNRLAPVNHMQKICSKLEISEEDIQLLNDMVAVNRGNGCPDINPYIGRKNLARVALRKAIDKDISDEKWEEIIRIIDTP